jgi:aryl-alcohol dehydrogenase-like predicted oxidoreductase
MFRPIAIGVSLLLLAPSHEAFMLWAPTTRPTTARFSSTPEDDEVSKLIGKRNQIKRQRKQEETPSLPEEPTVDLDLSNLPAFKTERPVRNKAPKETTDQKKEKDSDTKPKYDTPIVDYMADYEDENDFHIPNRMGITTIAWGDPKRNFVASGKLTKRAIKSGLFVPGDIQLAHNDLLAAGITFVETSASYGGTMSSHDILKRCLAERPEGVPECQIAETYSGNVLPTVLATLSMNTVVTTEKAMVNSLEKSLTKLGDLSTIELLQVPYSWYSSTSALSKGLIAVLESGQANTVGVVGVTNGRKIRKLCNQLAAADYSLTSNAFDFSLTNRKNEALIDICKEFNVIPLITNPLDNGLASGIFTAMNPTGGGRGVLSLSSSNKKYTFKELEKYQAVHSVLETVAERVRTRVIRNMRDTQERFKSKYGPPPQINTDITTTQVALNYVIAKGGVPLPEVNSPTQAKEVLGCLGWTLDTEEVNMLESAAALSKL